MIRLLLAYSFKYKKDNRQIVFFVRVIVVSSSSRKGCEQEKWSFPMKTWFTVTECPWKYQNDLKSNVKKEKSELSDKIGQLKKQSLDGKFYREDIDDTKKQSLGCTPIFIRMRNFQIMPTNQRATKSTRPTRKDSLCILSP